MEGVSTLGRRFRKDPLEAEFPPLILKAVPCPELWPSLLLRDIAQSTGESSIPAVCTIVTARAPSGGGTV